LSDDSIPALSKILAGDDDKAKEIVEAAKISMGTDISPVDLINIDSFAGRVVNLTGMLIVHIRTVPSRSHLYRY
jgi:nucleolar protein 56